MLRVVSIRAGRKIESVCPVNECIQEILLNLASECRSEGCTNLAERYIQQLGEMSSDMLNDMKVNQLLTFSLDQ